MSQMNGRISGESGHHREQSLRSMCKVQRGIRRSYGVRTLAVLVPCQARAAEDHLFWISLGERHGLFSPRMKLLRFKPVRAFAISLEIEPLVRLRWTGTIPGICRLPCILSSDFETCNVHVFRHVWMADGLVSLCQPYRGEASAEVAGEMSVDRRSKSNVISLEVLHVVEVCSIIHPLQMKWACTVVRKVYHASI